MKMSQWLWAVWALVFSSTALAEGAAAAGQEAGGFGPIVFLVLIVVFMYFMVWRPQQKKAKEHKALMSGVSKDDEVMLSAGIVGKVVMVHEQYLDIEIASNVVVTVQIGALASVLPKGTLSSLKK